MWLTGAALAASAISVSGSLGALDTWARPPAESARPGGERDRSSPFAGPMHEEPTSSFVPLAGDLGGAFAFSGSAPAANQAVQRGWGPLFVGGWILSLLDLNSGGGGSDDTDVGALSLPSGSRIAQSTPDLDISDPTLFAAILGGLATLFLCFGLMVLLRAWIAPGWIRLQQETHVQGTGSWRTLFGGRDRMLAMLGWRILRLSLLALPWSMVLAPGAAAFTLSDAPISASLAVIGVGAFLAFVCWLWVAPGLLLGEFFVALDGNDPVLALRRSLDAARGHRVELVVFYVIWAILQAVIVLAGMLLFCVGMLFTVPLGRAMSDSAWCRGFLLARDGLDAPTVWSALQEPQEADASF